MTGLWLVKLEHNGELGIFDLTVKDNEFLTKQQIFGAQFEPASREVAATYRTIGGTVTSGRVRFVPDKSTGGRCAS